MTSQGRVEGGGVRYPAVENITGRKHLSLPKWDTEHREEPGIEPGVRQVWADPAMVIQALHPTLLTPTHIHTHTTETKVGKNRGRELRRSSPFLQSVQSLSRVRLFATP